MKAINEPSLTSGDLAEVYSKRRTDERLYFRLKVEVWCLTRPARFIKPFVTRRGDLRDIQRPQFTQIYCMAVFTVKIFNGSKH